MELYDESTLWLSHCFKKKQHTAVGTVVVLENTTQLETDDDNASLCFQPLEGVCQVNVRSIEMFDFITFFFAQQTSPHVENEFSRAVCTFSVTLTVSEHARILQQLIWRIVARWQRSTLSKCRAVPRFMDVITFCGSRQLSPCFQMN